MHIQELCDKAHKAAKTKGFWDKPKEIGTTLMLIVSELGEALEAHRHNKHAYISNFIINVNDSHAKYNSNFEINIKDTFEDEIADTFIRLGDFCASLGIDIEKHIKLKMKYNSNRPYKHGKEY